MTTSPGQYDITIYQGATFSQQFIWKNEAGALVNLTGYTARMVARASTDASATLFDLTTANGRIALGGTAGTITVTMPATTTATLTRGGVYDLELTDGSGNVTRLLMGAIILSPEVTR